MKFNLHHRKKQSIPYVIDLIRSTPSDAYRPIASISHRMPPSCHLPYAPNSYITTTFTRAICQSAIS